MTLILRLFLLLLLLLSGPAQAQNFGNIPPQTVLGNPSTTAKQPAQPMPFSAMGGAVLLHVANNAALIASSRAQFPTVVVRDSVVTSGDAPASVWYSQIGTCASHSMVSDVGSCNDGSDGNSFVDIFPNGIADGRQWGIVSDNSTDTHVAANAAFTYSGSFHTPIWLPVGTMYGGATGFAIPPGATVVGAAMIPGNPPSGVGFRCPTTVSPNICVQQGISGSSAASSLNNAFISGGVQKTLYIFDGYNVQDNNIQVENGNDCLYLYSDNVNGGGIHHVFSHFNTFNCGHSHVTVNGVPEVYVTDARFGQNGPGDAVGTTAVFDLTGGFAGTNSGPNGVFCLHCQVNPGDSTNDLPAHFWNFHDIPATVGVSGFIFGDGLIDGHGGMTDLINIANTVSSIPTGFDFHDSQATFTGGTTTRLFGNVPTSTTIRDLSIHDNMAFSGLSLNLTATETYIHFNVSNTNLGGGNIAITGAAGSVASFKQVYAGGTCMIGGGAWNELTLSGLPNGSCTGTPTGNVGVVSEGGFLSLNTGRASLFGGAASLAYSIANNASQALPVAGLISAYVTSDGSSGLYLCGGGTCAFDATLSTGSEWVATTTTPGAGHASIAWNGSGGYSVYNAIGSTKSFSVVQLDSGNVVH